MKPSFLLPAAALLIGLAGGFIAGRSGQLPGPDEKDGSMALRKRTGDREGGGRPTAPKAVRLKDASEISRLPGGFSRTQTLIDYYGGLAAYQFEDEAKKIESLPPTERLLASYLLFARWGESDPQTAMGYAGAMGISGMFVRPTILQSWASVDPASASKYYQENSREFATMDMFGGRRGREMSMDSASSIIATEWAKQDPASALAWAQSITSPQKSSTISSVIGQVAVEDPKKATEMLDSLPAEERSGSYRSIATHYGSKDFAEAKTWIATLPAEDRDQAMASAIGGLSNTDPNAAAMEIASLPDGESKDDAVEEVVEDLALADPSAAAELLKKEGSESALRESMRDLMPAWVSKDPDAALAFANSYENGPIRDSAIQSYVWSHRTGAPEDLVRVAETISDEGDRSRTLGMSAMRWMREDETAAKAYIEQTESLSADAKQGILNGRGFWGRGGR